MRRNRPSPLKNARCPSTMIAILSTESSSDDEWYCLGGYSMAGSNSATCGTWSISNTSPLKISSTSAPLLSLSAASSSRSAANSWSLPKSSSGFPSATRPALKCRSLTMILTLPGMAPSSLPALCIMDLPQPLKPLRCARLQNQVSTAQIRLYV